MARKNPVSEREKQICRRLLEFRRSIKLSRKALAEEIGVTAEQLKSYETGRVPLPYLFVSKFCRSFDINPAWLAEGKEPVYGGATLDPKLESEIRPRQLFSFIYDDIIKPCLSDRMRVQSELEKAIAKQAFPGMAVEIIRGVGAVDTAAVLALISKTLSPLVNTLPPTLRMAFYRHIITAFYEFEKRHLEEITAFTKHRKPATPPNESVKVEKIVLTDAETSEKLAAVNHPLKKLLADLNQATSAPGQMSVLAKYLGEKTGANVPLASVSRWLSGKREPSGEITLWMREWVTDSKRQK